MCEFCLKHGEGEKWYLQAKNYSEDLLSDLRRLRFLDAMKSTVTHAVPIMFLAEFVASVEPEACSGCRQCMRLCQFGALSYSAGSRKAAVDQMYCYGCGICRSVCGTNAIRLEERAASPVAHLW